MIWHFEKKILSLRLTFEQTFVILISLLFSVYQVID